MRFDHPNDHLDDPSVSVCIRLYPSGAVWTDGPSNVRRLDPSGAGQFDAEHPVS
jgi:hypothetical protein